MESEAGYRSIRVLGLRIDRKTDILAATAFILALIGTGFQLFSFLRGADVTLYPPDQVIVFFDKYPGGDVIVRIAAVMSYVNQGATGYAATIRRERLTFVLSGRQFEQQWQSFARFDRRGSEFQFHRESDAIPTPVGGSSSISHSTVFAPHPIKCSPSDKSCDRLKNFLTKQDFLKRLDDTKVLDLRFIADIAGKETPLVASCSLELSDAMLTLLMANQWFTGVCWPTAYRP